MSKQTSKLQKNSENDKSVLELSLSKEYALYSNTHLVPYKTAIDTLIEESGKLQLNTYQSFIRNLFNPSSEYNSLLLIHGTGTGKTITSLSVAAEYIKQYKEYIGNDKNKIYKDIRSIIVIGYTKDIFKNELISHSEFGFSTQAEVAELKELIKSEYSSKAIAEKTNNLRNKLYRRISDRKSQGIYQFYGYRQLFNRVINQQDLLKELKKLQNNSDFTSIDPIKIREWIRKGSVRINHSFIESIRNSLFICDEVHNIYYNSDVNAYGLAIEIINDYFNEPKLYNLNWSINSENCLRWLYLSATPLTSSPNEIIPIINILNALPYRVRYDEIFNTKTKNIDPQGLTLIANRIDKKVSYVMDDNPLQYPSSTFIGTDLKDVPYLKFIRCKMSAQHQQLVKSYLSNDIEESDENFKKGNTIKDFVFQSANKKTLFFRYTEVLNEIKEGVSPYKEDKSGHLTGDLLSLKHLETYSSKYHKLLQTIIDLKSVEHGKIFIYHPYVQSTGTNLITSLLRVNGFLEGDERPNTNSFCTNCDKLFKDHPTKSCEFNGIRFVVVTGYISKHVIGNRLNQFNDPTNTDGSKIKILVGSKAMRESHTLKACRHIMIVHQPASISELIQIVGRGVRKNSHALLPAEKKSVNLYIFVNSNANGSGISLEESDYVEKMRLYLQIMQIERVLFNQSIDYLINFRFKQREAPRLIGESFALDKELYNKYEISKTISLNTTNTIRNDSFYFNKELEICQMIIKRILLEYQSVISKTQLYKLVLDPPFSVEADTKLLSKEAFETTLNNIIYYKTLAITIDKSTNGIPLIDALFDDSKVLIDTNFKRYYIYINKDDLIFLNPIDAPIDDLHKLLVMDSTPIISNQIDLEELSNRWNDLVQIENIVQDLEEEYKADKVINIKRLNQFTIETHAKLFEYCIVVCNNKIFNNSTISINKKLLIDLIDYYFDKGIVIVINDTMRSIAEPQYKKYYAQTGLSWKEVINSSAKVNRINYGNVPIGHYIKNMPKMIDINSLKVKSLKPIWNEYSALVVTKNWKYPYNIFGFDERTKGIDYMFKIRNLLDPSSKGINPMFMQHKDIVHIMKILKLKVNATDKKIDMVDQIKLFMTKTENKYRQTNSLNKIYFSFYETIPN